MGTDTQALSSREVPRTVRPWGTGSFLVLSSPCCPVGGWSH
jgi:hypothetical protein